MEDHGSLIKNQHMLLTISSTYLLLPKFYFHIIFLAACLTLYLSFMYGYDVPEFTSERTGSKYPCGKGETSPACNFGAYLDRAVFGVKYMMYPNDPEGIFTTLSSFVNTFAGLCFSLLMRLNLQVKGTNITLLKQWLILTGVFATFGCITVAIGEPVCKKRWSVSFAFFTSAISGLGLAICFYLVDILNKPFIKETLAKPFLWLGMNPLFIFVAMIAFDNLLMNNIKFTTSDGHLWNVWGWFNEKALNSWIGNEYVSSLTVSVLNLLLWLGVAYFLYARKIFIKL